MELDFELFDNYFMKIKKEMHKNLNKKFEKLELSNTNIKIIIMLYKHNGLTKKQLGEIIGLDKANITRAITSLEEKNYVKKPKEMQRGYIVELTPKAITIAKKAEAEMKKHSSHFFESLTKKEKETFINILDKFLNYIKEEY